MKPYDVLVIGSGVAAQTILAQLPDWRAGIIDERPLGGTCMLRGCDPKKVMVSAEEAVEAVGRLQGHGVAGRVAIDWPRLAAFKRRFTDPVPDQVRGRLEQQGVAIWRGGARFVGPNALEVAGARLDARHIVIASGACPVPLAIPGAELMASSADVLNLEHLPRRIVLIGGGYVAAEFSHLLARAGAEVTVLQRADRLLTAFDADLVHWLMAAFDDLGIAVACGREAIAVSREGDGLRVAAKDRDGAIAYWQADLVVHAAGRRPALAALDLKVGEVATEEGRIRLDRHLCSTSNPSVYAAGDAASAGPPLTPVASQDGTVVGANLRHGPGTRSTNYLGVPSVAFTLPAIAAVGLGEAAARARCPQLEIRAANTPQWFSARRRNSSIYGHKILIDPRRAQILGAHLVGPGAEELINVFALAIRHGLSPAVLRDTAFAYPTAASDIDALLG